MTTAEYSHVGEGGLAGAGTDYEALQKRQSDLIRKALAGSVFAAPYSATLPTSLTTGAQSELNKLPNGYTDVGWINKDDGVKWARETEAAEVNSWGSFDPTRRDVNKDVTTVAFTAQETNATTLGMFNNVDTKSLTPDRTTGEVNFPQATRPQTRYYRIFAIFVDGAGADAIYVARLLPRAMVSEVGEQTWSDGDDPVAYEMTLTATPDSKAGFSVRHFFGGPGWKKQLAAMGFSGTTPT